jgi:lysophospholipase L1-like esterase
LTNRFEILSGISEDGEQHHSPTTVRLENILKPVNQLRPKWRQRKPNTILLFSDSHGRGLSAKMSEKVVGKNHEIVGVVKANARLNEVTKHCEESAKTLSKRDNVIIMAGTNDIYLNRGNEVIDRMTSLVQNLTNTNVLIVNIPHRHDIPSDSCVNLETKRVNVELKKIGNSLDHVKVIDVNSFERTFYTSHGLHLNSKGKNYLCSSIVDCIGTIESNESSMKADDLVTANVPVTNIPSL